MTSTDQTNPPHRSKPRRLPPRERLRALLGIESRPASHHERWLAMAGGVLGIALVFAAAALHPLGPGSTLVVASMGASAVLIFAVPHGALSQPWPVIGGHLLSAFIGVTAAHWIPSAALAGPLAVGLAIVTMHYARCLHPPGGATALTAIIGGAEIQALGYGYLLAPVLVNAALLVAAGILLNFPFRWRRYPAALAAPAAAPGVPDTGETPTPPALGHDDLVYALGRMDSFIDVSEADLAQIFALAAHHAQERHPGDLEIRPGRCYSNGRYGADWAVRRVITVEPGGAEALVSFRGAAGTERRTRGTLSRAAFADWARHEVERDETTWRRVVHPRPEHRELSTSPVVASVDKLCPSGTEP
ncbi:MAG: HPP family protein [Lamprocystis purpurea]|uniref:HPP family protein n=1 Tax=Lamprocystis purpurea TaxID=61598 RepID=UPI000370C894|nr:HPP family protein [Lamprocystis purpurea]MBV5272402.1 HPP family protein [Lamprocystis purpurea]